MIQLVQGQGHLIGKQLQGAYTEAGLNAFAQIRISNYCFTQEKESSTKGLTKLINSPNHFISAANLTTSFTPCKFLLYNTHMHQIAPTIITIIQSPPKNNKIIYIFSCHQNRMNQQFLNVQLSSNSTTSRVFFRFFILKLPQEGNTTC